MNGIRDCAAVNGEMKDDWVHNYFDCDAAGDWVGGLCRKMLIDVY